MGFILGPLLMEPSGFPSGCGDTAETSTDPGGSLGDMGSGSGEGGGGCSGARLLHGLYYAEAAFAAVVFVLILLHFPAKPPTPPTYVHKQSSSCL